MIAQRPVDLFGRLGGCSLVRRGDDCRVVVGREQLVDVVGAFVHRSVDRVAGDVLMDERAPPRDRAALDDRVGHDGDRVDVLQRPSSDPSR